MSKFTTIIDEIKSKVIRAYNTENISELDDIGADFDNLKPFIEWTAFEDEEPKERDDDGKLIHYIVKWGETRTIYWIAVYNSSLKQWITDITDKLNTEGTFWKKVGL